MKRTFAAMFLFLLVLGAYALVESRKDAVVPRADSCPLCGEYNYCSEQPSFNEAADVLRAYYREKGMDARAIKQDGRLLEAEIYKGGDLVDRVLLDLRTGRIKSIK
ncbi:MAG TPA: hypothetical protein VF790_03340 [Dissulfurispiraceae bacterium]